MAKKRKLSGLSALELQSAYNSLLKLKRNIVHEESDEDPNESAPEGFERQVDKTLSLLGSKLEGPKSYSITMENLTKLNITFTAFLYLKPNPEERIAATTSLGQNELWSSANLYRHLHLLESLIPRTTETSGRAWIEAFFFRASAMLPPNKRMVLNMEHVVQATTASPSSLSSLSGFVDYTAVVASQCDAAIFMKTPQLHVLKRYMPSGFFVVEAQVFNISDHVPQAVCEMYACGTLLEKNVLRGALTNGHDWIFLLIELNDDYDGASYKQSDVIQLETTKRLDGSLEIHRPWPDLIAAILSHWIENGFAELGSDDWFGVHESTAV
ncbi:hypothetical protein BJ138DRAFT_1009256 [Hygrophoropsis aurantiaca]|uniref:Uncharacterized protein n=1 Tax=Hygrophoropsis aurantiaca TaxID=72124 RepID=A0ACB8A9V0_9AGAM|nr:hypothetical protein BJ138DRAFT_1009256 [Hygrophoropsis aurantiaca]